MTCEECEHILLDSRQHEKGEGWMLRTSWAALIHAHIENCPACATKMSEITRLQDALRQLRVATIDMQAPATVENNLLRAFRQETTRRHRSLDGVFAWRLAWLSTATLVLIAAGIFFGSRFRPSLVGMDKGNREGHEARIEPRSAGELSGTGAEDFHLNNLATGKDDTVDRTHAVVKVPRAVSESSSRQVAVPREDLSLNGGGSIVRVTLPFSSLVAMGVPVRPDLSESRVTADVWMDPFGAVVGVRLVPAKTNAD